MALCRQVHGRDGGNITAPRPDNLKTVMLDVHEKRVRQKSEAPSIAMIDRTQLGQIRMRMGGSGCLRWCSQMAGGQLR